MQRSTLALLLTPLVLVAAACGADGNDSARPGADGGATGGGGTAASEVVIKIENLKFVEPTVTVAVGGTVTFDNVDNQGHTATATDAAKTFNTEVMDAGSQSEPITFDEPGTYPYYCSLHPFMKGEIVVQ